MKNDSLILQEGMTALRNSLGLVDAEKFIHLIKIESFDYTEWQKSLWDGKTVSEIFDAAAKSVNSDR